MFWDILKSLFNALCGSPQESQKPPQQPPVKPPHRPSQKPPQQPPLYPPHRPSQHVPQKHGDPNQINQNNEEYKSLRARANEEGDKMAKCFEQSHEAYARKDGAGAKQLSNQGKTHQRNMENLNKQASDWIFIENNKDSQPGEIDLHGLYVKEAIWYTDRALQEAKQRGDSEVHLIVGKGLHSQNGAAKIKPAIEQLMQKHQLFAHLDPNNAGVLIVQINSSGDRGIGSEEITRRLQQRDEGCVVM